MINKNMVRKERLELSRVAPLEPKSSASTNSATFADDSARCYNKSRKIKTISILYLEACGLDDPTITFGSSKT